MPFRAFDHPNAYTLKLRVAIDGSRVPVNWLPSPKAAQYVGVSLAALRKRWRARGLNYFRRDLMDAVCVTDLRDWISERTVDRYVRPRR